MFALVSILSLCLGLALWRAFRDHPTDRVRMSGNETRSNISKTENGTTREGRRLKLTKRSECDEGVVWLDDPAYDIDPRSSNNPDNVWEVSGHTIILHVDRMVATPHCIMTMSVAVGGSIIEFQAPIEDVVTLNNTGWDGCSSIEASVTVFDEQNRTDRREKNIEPEEDCDKRFAEFSKAPAGSAPSTTEGANVAGPVLGGVVLCIVVVVLVFGVTRTSIGRGTRKATVSAEGENNVEDIPMRPLSRKTSKRKSQIRERVDERMRTEPIDVEGCRYSFVQDYGTAYDRNLEDLSQKGYNVDSAVKRDNFHTTLRDNSSVA